MGGGEGVCGLTEVGTICSLAIRKVVSSDASSWRNLCPRVKACILEAGSCSLKNAELSSFFFSLSHQN